MDWEKNSSITNNLVRDSYTNVPGPDFDFESLREFLKKIVKKWKEDILIELYKNIESKYKK